MVANMLLAAGLALIAQGGESRPSVYQPPAAGEIETEEMQDTDDIVTEEDYVLERPNYRIQPEDTNATPLITKEELRIASDIDLNRAAAALEEALGKCISLRHALEERIGTRPGSYSVHPQWGTVYMNCVKQRDRERRLLTARIEERRRQIVASGEDEGATLYNGLIDRLAARSSRLAVAINDEKKMMPAFVRYYNTGERDY